ncbi:MAG: hypothetical protein ACK4MR_00615, partial [Erythrobacter cryptus]
MAVLLPFAVPQEQGLAQGLDAASPRIISNIAEASWQADGARRRANGNRLNPAGGVSWRRSWQPMQETTSPGCR